MKYGYIYIIYFTDHNSSLYNHFYIGQRKLHKNESLYDPNGKNYYHGSSTIAQKEYWPYYSLHKKEILCWCDSKEELFEKEHYFILQHINNPLCINKNTGGSAKWPGWNKGLKTPEETRKKQSEAKFKYFSEHECYNKNRTHSKESKKNMKEGTQRFYDNGGHPWNYNKKMSEEFCINNRKAQQKHWSTHDQHNKNKICINNGVNNKYVSEEELDNYLNLGYKLGMLYPKERKSRKTKQVSSVTSIIT